MTERAEQDMNGSYGIGPATRVKARASGAERYPSYKVETKAAAVIKGINVTI
jgi:hypothetical protein